jgi:hypothetical protein
MKILGISILMAGFLMTFSLLLDLLQGFDVRTSLYNALSPFRVMESPEFFVLFFFLFLLVAKWGLAFYKNKHKKMNEP